MLFALDRMELMPYFWGKNFLPFCVGRKESMHAKEYVVWVKRVHF